MTEAPERRVAGLADARSSLNGDPERRTAGLADARSSLGGGLGGGDAAAEHRTVGLADARPSLTGDATERRADGHAALGTGPVRAEIDLVVVTGVSGGGRSTVARALENVDFYVVDNLPQALMLDLVE